MFCILFSPVFGVSVGNLVMVDIAKAVTTKDILVSFFSFFPPFLLITFK